MLSQHYTTSNTAYFPSMPKGKAIEVLLEMVERCLIDFPDNLRYSYSEFSSVAEKTPERLFSWTFSQTLQRTIAQYGFAGLFAYHDENINPQKLLKKEGRKGMPPQEDLGICFLNNGELVLAIEGKRLYNPTEKQYVSGRTGGIARFKREEHGEGVNLACIVGYVQTNTFAFWHEKINGWIRSENAPIAVPVWDDSDCLNPITEKAEHFAHCFSQHRRTSKEPIGLHHFWVKVT